MKSRLVLLVAAMMAFSFLQAQGLHFGIKGGANLTKVDGKAMSDEFNYGYHLGGFAEIGLGKKWFIQPELLWSEYKTRTADDFEDIVNNALDNSSRQDVKLNYLSIPITLNYRLLDWFSVQAGPQFGVLLNSDKNLLENGKDAFNAGVVSLAAGAQLNFGAFRITGRYFTNINEINSGDIDNAWRNKGFQVGVGVKIF